MRNHSVFVYILLVTLLQYVCGEANEKQNSTFQPTSEWQKVEEGQIVPPGLHVRVNLETGYKEAKFPDFKKETTALVFAKDNERPLFDSTPLSLNELKKIIESVRGGYDGQDTIAGMGSYNHYEQSMGDLSNLNNEIVSDIQYLREILEDFKTVFFLEVDAQSFQYNYDFEEEEIVDSLYELESLLYHLDNRVEFAKQNGFSVVLHKCINSSNTEIRHKALEVHALATHSNPEGQTAALDTGSMNMLLKILALDQELNQRAQSIFALSCLLRGYPAAQQKFISDGGLAVFAAIFDEEKKDLFYLQHQIIGILYEVMYEREDTKIRIAQVESKNEKGGELSMLKEKLHQYERMNLEKNLLEENWCKILSSWYIKQNFMTILQEAKIDPTLQSPTSHVHDVVERVTNTLEIMADVCKSQLQKENEFLALLNEMSQAYAALIETEGKRNCTDVDCNHNGSVPHGQFANLLRRLKSLAGKLGNIPQHKEEL